MEYAGGFHSLDLRDEQRRNWRQETIEATPSRKAYGLLDVGEGALSAQPPSAFRAGVQTRLDSTEAQLHPDGHDGCPSAQDRLHTGGWSVSAKQ